MGGKTGPHPTDRAKSGTKRSLLVEGEGVPVGLAVAGANVNDFKLGRETFDSVPGRRPRASLDRPQNWCLDKGYDDDEVRDLAREFRFTAHIRSRGQEAQLIRRRARFKARRGVCERTHSGMNRFRRILIRWEKKPENYLGMLHLTLACITYQASQLFWG